MRHRRQVKGGLVYHEGVRHPYEYLQNDAYIAFLATGLKCPSCHHGRNVGPEDITWDIPTPVQGFDAMHLVRRLNRHYDLRHPAIRDNLYLQNLGRLVDDAVRQTALELQVHLFTYARLDSFKRLWTSLAAADPPSALTSVVIFIYHDHGGGNHEHDAYLRGLTSRLGPVYVQSWIVLIGMTPRDAGQGSTMRQYAEGVRVF